MKLWALHGFLGRPQDFSKLDLDLQAVDYLRIPQLSSKLSLKQWGENFCSYVGGDENYLVGYSQGGRLALQAVKANPKMWKGLILLSTNPGIPEAEKPARLKNDKLWADKFLSADFQKVLQEWNQQSVFAGSVSEPLRDEHDYSKEDLANCLINWSVSAQEDFRSFLKQSQIPVHYLCGEKDSKYCAIGDELESLASGIKKTVIRNAGHRLLFDNPEMTRESVLHSWGLRDGLARNKIR